MTPRSSSELAAIARRIRAAIIRMTTAAGAGHLTSSLSAVELMVSLFFGGVFRADLKRPGYPNNDRLIFSKGHASPLLYALYAAAGAISPGELMKYRTFGSRLEGHPTKRWPFTEVPTGSLGQGLSLSLGEAIAADIQRLSYRVYCLLGDSELAEGSVWEAIQLAGFRRQANLIAMVDFNGLGQAGPTMFQHHPLALARRVQSFGWRTAVVDGHNLNDLAEAFTRIPGKHPLMIIGRTVKGKGLDMAEGKPGWHAKVLSGQEARLTIRQLGTFDPRVRGVVARPEPVRPAISASRSIRQPKYSLGVFLAPRAALGNALIRLAPKFPGLVVLDVEVKNSTYTEGFGQKYPARFVQGYVAEQNIVSLAGGLAARGLVPVTATFAAFFTRAHDQLRMAGYAGTRQVYIGTHAGVHIGTDGVSQMGLQDISLFRSIENSRVLYPADAMAAERLLEQALAGPGISYIRATRAEVPVVYTSSVRFPVGGSHVLRRSRSDRATIVAAGITLHEALQAADQLKKKRINVRVIDLYSIKPIDAVTLAKAARETKHLLVVEDHYPEGGIAEAVRSALSRQAGAVISLAVRKTPRSGQPEELLAYEGIDAGTITKAILKL